MAYCIKCSKQNPDTAKFCTSCGSTLKASVIQKVQPTTIPEVPSAVEVRRFSKKRTNWLIIGILFFLGLCAVAYFIFFNKKTSTASTVGPSFPTIVLEKMNVLYIGVDNPVSISSPAGGADKLQISIQGGGGSITSKEGGHFIARVNNVTDDCEINVSLDGRVVGSSKFRVCAIPEAQAHVGGKPSGVNIPASVFKEEVGVSAGIKNFPFELSYDIASFTFTIDTDDDIVSIPNQGGDFTDVVKSALYQHAKPGRIITIDDIRVNGPDGRTTRAPSLIFYLK